MTLLDLQPGKVYKIKLSYGYYFKYKSRFENEVITEWAFIKFSYGYRFFPHPIFRYESLEFEEVDLTLEELKAGAL